MTSHQWTDSIVQRLRDLHATNLSFSEIAVELNEEFATSITRNACIGKSKRIGLPERAMTQAERGKLSHDKWRMVRVKKAVPQQPKISVPKPSVEDVTPLHVSFMDLERDQCRFPYGDGPSFTFCGCRAFDGGSYCEPHHTLTHMSKQEFVQRKDIERGKFMAAAA